MASLLSGFQPKYTFITNLPVVRIQTSIKVCFQCRVEQLKLLLEQPSNSRPIIFSLNSCKQSAQSSYHVMTLLLLLLMLIALETSFPLFLNGLLPPLKFFTIGLAHSGNWLDLSELWDESLLEAEDTGGLVAEAWHNW